MRIHTLSFQALGPFPGQHVIAFDGLGDASLFLIDGPTGAGKSTVIDAIVFALYGDVAGRTSNRQRLRSDFATADVDSYAELDFSTSAGRFKVRRSPEYARAKKRGTGVTTVPSSVIAFRSTGEGWEAVSGSKGEADAEILGWVGLTRAQFLQTVVLPQGEFANFLAAESKDRLAVLERIFATELYSRIEQVLDERRREAEHGRDLAKEQVGTAVRAVYSRLPDDHPLRATVTGEGDPGEDVASAPLDRLRGDVASALARQSEEAEHLADQLAAADRDLSGRRAVAEARRRLREAEGRLADALRVEAAAGAALGDHAAVLAEVGTQAGDVDRALTTVVRALGQRTHAAELEAALPDEEAVEAERARSVDVLDQQLAALDDERDHGLPRQLQDLADRVGATLAAASEDAERARSREGVVIQARLDGMAAELAAELVDGQPCAVCGATSHPAPARPADQQVTPADLSAAARARRVADDHRHAVDVQRAALGAVGDVPQVTGVPTARVDDVATLGVAIADVRERLASIGERRALLDLERAGAVAELEQARAVLVDHREAVIRARGRFASVASLMHALGVAQSGLEAARSAAGAVEAARTAVETAKSDPALQPGQLSGPPAADDDLAPAIRAREELAARDQQAQVALAGTQALHRDLTTRIAAVADAVTAARLVDERTADVIALASVVKGGEGNTLAQPLSAFVVQTMFDEVLVGANRRLRVMLDGRFELLATESRTGRALTGLGLGLEVRDLRTETTRKTSTLSGGEAFCASLALALGLADAVRAHAGGIDIGMLFVDEGFGSLDVDRLDDVMTELGRLQADGRTVAVISHVSEMKRAITERIDVRVLGPRSGSTLDVSWTD